MGLQVFYDLRSEPCRAVYYLLKAANVKFQPRIVDLWKGEQNKPEFLKMNPSHKVPVINDDGFVLTESVAILKYIAIRSNAPDHWYPRLDLQKQARVDEFFSWYHGGWRKPCIDCFFAKYRSRADLAHFPKIPYNAKQIQDLEKNLGVAIKNLDELFLKDKAFIAGDEISVADLVAYSELLQQTIVEDGDYIHNDNVTAWMKRVAEYLSEIADETLSAMKELKDVYNEAKQ